MLLNVDIVPFSFFHQHEDQVNSTEKLLTLWAEKFFILMNQNLLVGNAYFITTYKVLGLNVDIVPFSCALFISKRTKCTAQKSFWLYELKNLLPRSTFYSLFWWTNIFLYSDEPTPFFILMNQHLLVGNAYFITTHKVFGSLLKKEKNIILFKEGT